jgi:hypothetical protein
MTNNEITTQKSGFMELSDFDYSDFIAEEFDGLTLSFEKIKIPAAGSIVFEVPGSEPGCPDTVKEFSAVILHHHALNAYYKEKYTGGANPPDCSSMDGKVGIGNPGGVCKTCPLNKFGSGGNKKKACQNRRRLFLLREGDVLPMILSLSPGSLAPYTRYIASLLNNKVKTSELITKFSLQKYTGEGGLVSSQAQFRQDRRLTPEENELVSSLAVSVKAFALQLGQDAYSDIEPDHEVDSETGEITESLE